MSEKGYSRLPLPLPSVLLETQYLGGIAYFAIVSHTKKMILEFNEHYQRTSQRNRCRILTADGILSLSIPLVGGKGGRTPIAEKQMDENQDWKRIHWESLCSAYRSSAYFEYYEDSFKEVFFTQNQHLFDFNLQLLEQLLIWLAIDCEIEMSTAWNRTYNDQSNIRDFRGKLDWKNKEINSILSQFSYNQVFESKQAFQPNLSVVDLLFNKGPESRLILEEIGTELLK